MAISLRDLKRVKADDPPRILLYGVPKIGKTTLASEFPNPVFIQAEDGTPSGVDLITFGKVNSLQDVYDAFEALATEGHDFRTLVIDSLSALEQIIWAQVCADNKWDTIEAPGYGKGYIAVDLHWLKIMQSISYLRRERQMIIVLIAHSEIKHIEDPLVGPYDRFSVQMHKRAVEIVNKEVDVIAFLNYRVGISESTGVGGKKIRKAVGVGERILHFADRPGFVAGDRYDFPDEIIYERGKGFAKLAKYLPTAQISPRYFVHPESGGAIITEDGSHPGQGGDGLVEEVSKDQYEQFLAATANPQPETEPAGNGKRSRQKEAA